MSRAIDPLALHADMAAPAKARRFIRTALTDAGCEDFLDDAILLTSELVTNAVEHGSGPITLEAEIRPDGILISVTDSAELAPAPGNLDESSLRGRGLLLVQEIAGAWGWRPLPRGQGKVVWFRLP